MTVVEIPPNASKVSASPVTPQTTLVVGGRAHSVSSNLEVGPVWAVWMIVTVKPLKDSALIRHVLAVTS